MRQNDIYDKHCISVTEVFGKSQQVSVRVQISKVISFKHRPRGTYSVQIMYYCGCDQHYHREGSSDIHSVSEAGHQLLD